MENARIFKHPLGEVFGFPISNVSEKAKRYRDRKLCPYNNKVPNCTKDKANDPLGVCSVMCQNKPVITCPTRFREDWIIVENAANFAFQSGTKWTSLSEIKLLDKNGQSAGNIDYVLVAYDGSGKILDFASLEVQGVYISGNLRNPFDSYLSDPKPEFHWNVGYNYPKPDYLSSSRKRLIPQMLYKGGIFHFWNKKQAVALQKSFFNTLPELPSVPEEDADIAWFLYDLIYDESQVKFDLTLVDTVYTKFESALRKVTTPLPGELGDFVNTLQGKLDERLEGNAPETHTLFDLLT